MGFVGCALVLGVIVGYACNTLAASPAQAKGIVPDIMVDDTAEGSPFAVLRMREADLEKHLSGGEAEKKLSSRARKLALLHQKVTPQRKVG